MKIEIKNIKVNLAFSEETTCFTADIFVDGIKTAYARNDGRGGSTHYCSYHKPNDDENLRQAEAFAKTMPSHFYEYGGVKREIKSDLETIIDFAIDDFVKAKEVVKFNKKLEKAMVCNIVYGVPNTGKATTIGYGKTPIATVVKHPQSREGFVKLLARIKSELKDGEVILNTNLAELGF